MDVQKRPVSHDRRIEAVRKKNSITLYLNKVELNGQFYILAVCRFYWFDHFDIGITPFVFVSLLQSRRHRGTRDDPKYSTVVLTSLEVTATLLLPLERRKRTDTLRVCLSVLSVKFVRLVAKGFRRKSVRIYQR